MSGGASDSMRMRSMLLPENQSSMHFFQSARSNSRRLSNHSVLPSKAIVDFFFSLRLVLKMRGFNSRRRSLANSIPPGMVSRQLSTASFMPFKSPKSFSGCSSGVAQSIILEEAPIIVVRSRIPAPLPVRLDSASLKFEMKRVSVAFRFVSNFCLASSGFLLSSGRTSSRNHFLT